jgi:hypothetical protein
MEEMERETCDELMPLERERGRREGEPRETRAGRDGKR